MSAYVNFYLKSKNKEYLPIGTFGRSSIQFEAIEDFIPYGKNVALSRDTISEVIDELSKSKKTYGEMIDREKQTIEFVKSCNAPLEEKEEKFCEILNNIESINEEIEWVDVALAFYCTLRNIYDEAVDTKYYENKDYCYDATDYIWAGIEAGYPKGDCVEQ